MSDFNNGNYVLGRDLQKELGIKERYSRWFSKVSSVFVVDKDYVSFNDFAIVNNGAKRTITNHKISTQMANEIKNNYHNKLHKHSNSSDHVYVVSQIGLNGYYKIGITNNMKSRLSNFNNVAPIGINVEVCIESEDTPLIEKYFHQYFKDYNSNLEWYKLSDDQLQELINYLETYEQIEQGNFVDSHSFDFLPTAHVA